MLYKAWYMCTCASSTYSNKYTVLYYTSLDQVVWSRIATTLPPAVSSSLPSHQSNREGSTISSSHCRNLRVKQSP